MTKEQKAIRVGAIFLAIIIITGIISSIIFGFSLLFKIFSKDDKTLESNKNLIIENNYDIKNIDIDLSYTKLIIKTGMELKVETNNKDILISENNHSLKIEEKNRNIFLNHRDYELILYLKSEDIFNDIKIKTLASNVEIESLKCYTFDFDFKAGLANILNLTVINETKIKGGAGSIKINNGSLHNLNLNIDVLKFDLKSFLSGNISLDSKIGDISILILGKKDDYTFDIDKRIGSIIIDSSKFSDKKIYGQGKNYVKINDGIGKINIDFLVDDN